MEKGEKPVDHKPDALGMDHVVCKETVVNKGDSEKDDVKGEKVPRPQAK